MRRALAVAAASLAAALSTMTLALEARADDETGVLMSGRHEFESPQNFNLELRFSPYVARVDYDPSLSGNPYSSTFGTTPRLEFAGEFDWEAFRVPHVGTLGLGGSVGFTQMTALALLANPPPPPASPYSAEKTDLTIIPMYAVVVLRADVLDRDAHIPIVPYVKVGLGMALWRAHNDGGTSTVTTSSGTSVTGEGHTVGTQVALGLGFDLNVLDEHTARAFDNAIGVNHTYIFGEAYVSTLQGLGQAHAMWVGNGSFTAPAWAFGMAFEF